MTNVLTREQKVERYKGVMNNLFDDNALTESVVNLADRWRDECKYEDFAEYEAVLKTWKLPEHCTFVKASKRPFGIVMTIEGLDSTQFLFCVSGNALKFKQV